MALPYAPVQSPAELRSKRHSKVTHNPFLGVQALARPSHFTFKKMLGLGIVARFPKNTASWHTEHFKPKGFEETAEAGRSL